MMDMKIQAEKDRHNLMSKKMESGTRLNEELKKEYTTQLALFKVSKIPKIIICTSNVNLNL